MTENTGYPRWIDPNGEIHLFMNCKNIEDDGASCLFVESFGVNPTESVRHEFVIDEDIEEAEAEDVVKRWKEYLNTLVSTKPFPNTKDAQTAGCRCKIDYAHDPYCPVVAGNSSIRATPDPLASDAPTTLHPQGTLEDILADLVQRMMDQNCSLDTLVKALTPPPHQDPYYVPIPGFRTLADREPTPTERQCFLAGVVSFAARLKQINISVIDPLSRFMDELGVATVKCEGCGFRVPIERTFRVEGVGLYGIDCCKDDDDEN